MKKWSDFDEEEQLTINMLASSLQEFSYGFEIYKAGVTEAAIKRDSLFARFYLGALYNYVANFFLITGKHKLAGAFERLGLGNLLDPIKKILDRPTGRTNLGRFLDEFRDKYLTHNSFTSSGLEKVHKDFDPALPEDHELFGQLTFDLFEEIYRLYEKLRMLYPQTQTFLDALDSEIDRQWDGYREP